VRSDSRAQLDASPLAETNAVHAGFKEFLAKPITHYTGLKMRVGYWLAERARSSPAARCEMCGTAARDAGAA
jgi:hypothetical protein